MTWNTESCICLLWEINTFKEALDFKNDLNKYNGHTSSSESVFYFSQNVYSEEFGFYVPLYKLIYSFIFLLLVCSQGKPISLSSSSDFSKSEHPISRGGYTLPHHCNPAVEYNLFSEEQRGEGQKQMAITLRLWRARRLVFSHIWIRVRKYTCQSVAKENTLPLNILKFVLVSSGMWSSNIIIHSICMTWEYIYSLHW